MPLWPPVTSVVCDRNTYTMRPKAKVVSTRNGPFTRSSGKEISHADSAPAPSDSGNASASGNPACRFIQPAA
jgi:hypothetical protein